MLLGIANPGWANIRDSERNVYGRNLCRTGFQMRQLIIEKDVWSQNLQDASLLNAAEEKGLVGYSTTASL